MGGVSLLDSAAYIIAHAAEIFSTLVQWLVGVIGRMGYAGIAGLMFLESSFFPFPSEVVVPPAGYLAWKGEMNLFLVIASGIAGSVLGGLFNYWVAIRWGRPLFEKYGKYFFVTEESLKKAENFFARHGHISTFTGRLLPVIRQYISLPAGLARMPLPQFTFYTALGSGVWVVILALVGYFFGSSGELIHSEMKKASVSLIVGCAALIAVYVVTYKRRQRKK